MAIFKPIPKSELGTTYTHYGMFMGVVPVYVGDVESWAPLMTERNWVPAWYLSAIEALFGLFCMAATAVRPDYEPMYAIRLTGRITP